MAIFPGAISTDSDLYIAVNNLSALLTDNPLTIGATTVNVNSTTLFPTVGFISIDAEIIKYTGKTATSFTGCTRGADGSTAAAHSLGAQVDHNVVAAHHNANKDEIKAIEQNLSDRIGLSATQLLAPLGSAGAPTYSFTGDPNTGIYSGTADRIDFTAGGTVGLRIRTLFNESLTPFNFAAGSAAAPSITFDADTTKGFYSSGASAIGFVTSGTLRFELLGGTLSGAATEIKFGNGSVLSPTYSFSGDLDTGFYWRLTNSIGVSCGNLQVFDFNPTVQRVIAGNFAIISTGGVLMNNDGTTAAPSYTFSSDSDKGFYLRDANSVAYSNASRESVIFTGAGQGGQSSVGAFNINTGTPSTANTARLTAQTGTGDGDAFVSLTANGSSWHMGIDVSDSNVVSFGTSGTVGNSQIMRASATIGVQHLGTTTNDNALAGYVGEEVVSTISTFTNTPATTNFGDLTSISLTAGDWDVYVSVEFFNNGATWTSIDFGTSDTSGNSATNLVRGYSRFQAAWASTSTATTQYTASFVVRVSISATSTRYFKYRSVFSAGTPQAIGTITARRVR